MNPWVIIRSDKFIALTRCALHTPVLLVRTARTAASSARRGQLLHVCIYVFLCVLDTPISCAEETSAPIEKPSGVWTRVMGLRNHVRLGLYIGAIWRMRLNDRCEAAMRAVASISVTASVLWRQEAQPAYKYGNWSDKVSAWLPVWSEVQMTCTWSS